MHLIGPTNVNSDDYIPFSHTETNWAIAGNDSMITYNPVTKHFEISYASTNDYYINWQVALVTATTQQYPILSLELSYNGLTRCDAIIAPMKTDVISNSSLFHITQVSLTDQLLIGLKVIGDSNGIYHLESDSSANISANIIILGL